jgi:peptide/nickel transport system substrate-binding protein
MASVNLLWKPTTGNRAITSILSVVFAVIILVVTACGSSKPTHANKVLWLGAHIGGEYVQSLSPYDSNPNEGIRGMVYETLLFFNRHNGQTIPWLALSYQFNHDLTELTFTTRENVKWSDGQPFTARDVAFTFNMLKQYPDADANGVWINLSKVEAPDDHTVVFTFQNPYPPAIWLIGGQTYIVPQHIFESIGDPSKNTSVTPVGTGPFVLKSFSTQMLDYTRNPHFWKSSSLFINELKYPAVKDNQTVQLMMMSGQADWGGFFAPDLDTTFLLLDPDHNHYWMAPVGFTSIYMNMQKPEFTDVTVRQAISLALDRQSMSHFAESGYEGVGSPTGIILPGMKNYLNPQYANLQFTQNAAQANTLLQNAGYKRGPDGVYVSPQGKRMAFSINVVAGWTDWETVCQIIAKNLLSIGFIAKVNALSFADYDAARINGTYDMFMGGSINMPIPYYLFNDLLNSKNLAPKGHNYERWVDPETDQYLQQYANTTDPTIQAQAINGLEKIMVEKVPVVLLLNAADWFEYTSTHFTGWPTPSNPYALGAAYEMPDCEQVVLHLRSV